MKWEKIGRIFDPVEHPSLPNCEFYAQSPQALVFDDFVRIYFSTREQDRRTKKFLSQVSYVDMTKDFRAIISVAQRPVVELGALGCFDEHGIFPFSPLRVDDKIYAYTCGWSRRVSVSVETGIGLVISDDQGKTFNRIGSGPVLSATLNEPCLVGDGFVKRINGRFCMWYIYGQPWKQFDGQSEPDRIYKIAYASSDDGVHWSKRDGCQLVSDVLDANECQALPTVVQIGSRYHMYFCYRHASDFRSNPSRAYRLGYCYSDDLNAWVRDDANAGIKLASDPEAWDGQMMCYPHIFECDSNVFMLYNGNEFGKRGFGLAVAK